MDPDLLREQGTDTPVHFQPLNLLPWKHSSSFAALHLLPRKPKTQANQIIFSK